MTAQLTDRAQAVIAASDEYTDPIFRAPSVGGSRVLDATEDYLEAQDALDNREANGINAEDFFVLMRRRNAARRDLDAAIAATAATGEAS